MSDEKRKERRRASKAAWYAANIERTRSTVAAYRAANTERLREADAVWRASNPGHAAAWRAANLERHRAVSAKYRAANPGRSQAWYAANREKQLASASAWAKANPDMVRSNTGRRRSLLRDNAVGTVTAADIRAIFEETCNTCVYCGDVATCLDHIIPLSKGGPHAIHNLAPACRRCNCSKGAKLVSEWKARKRAYERLSHPL